MDKRANGTGAAYQYGRLSPEELQELQKLETRFNAQRDQAIYLVAVHDAR